MPCVRPPISPLWRRLFVRALLYLNLLPFLRLLWRWWWWSEQRRRQQVPSHVKATLVWSWFAALMLSAVWLLVEPLLLAEAPLLAAAATEMIGVDGRPNRLAVDGMTESAFADAFEDAIGQRDGDG